MKSSITIAPTHEPTLTQCSAERFQSDVQFLETSWQCVPIAGIDLPLIDLGTGDPLVFVPILEHLEFVYARQLRAFSTSRRVILYRRQESRTHFISLAERVEELRQVLDSLDIISTDFVAHGDAAMVLFEFALRYPERCRSLVIIAQGADYRIAPHPFIWLLHELFLRLPIEHLVPASLIRRIVLRYITHTEPSNGPRHKVGCYGKDSARFVPLNANWYQDVTPTLTELPRVFIENQFRKIAFWPAVYRYSVLPIIHRFDIRTRLTAFTMPILLINRWDDALSPEAETAWLAQHLPQCVYHVVPAHGRFFIYSEAEHVTPLIETFLAT